MKTFTHEMAELIQRDQEEKSGYRPELNELSRYPHVKLCAMYFDALAHFNLQRHYFNLDDVLDPEEGITVWIRSEGKREQFKRVGKEWKFVQDLSDDIYR